MAGRVIVVQASSSEDESMTTPVAGGGATESSGDTTIQANETGANTENKITYRYDREDLLKLHNHPSAQIRPSVLSPEFDMVVENGEGGTGDSMVHNKLWNPELWIQSIWNPEPRQNSSTSASGSANHGWSARRQGDHDGHGLPMNKKKQIDRLKSESEDGIVLSPQRRSFGAGCQVASSSAAANASVAGSQMGVGGASSTNAHQVRRSASPVSGGGDDRQQQTASHQNARSSFRSRGAGSAANASMPQQASQVQNATTVVGNGSYGRGDRVENWRDRSAFASSSFGRGKMGKDVPASVNMYTRSRGGGGANSWNTGGNRRSYGGGGGYNHHGGEFESLPEWVTEGPSDMFETMELRGFDEEEREDMQMEQNSGAGMGQKRGGAGRAHQFTSSAGGLETYADKDRSTRRSIERGEQSHNSKRGNKSPGVPPPSRKSAGDVDKVVGKMPAEALVDGFDIGDMAQFLSVADADFDSITNGDSSAQGKTLSITGNVMPVPATPTTASRFSKFFASAGGRAGSDDKINPAVTQKGQQPVNIMELLSKAALAGDSGQAGGGGVAGTAVLPAGAKSLDEIEAAYKSKNATQISKADGSPNKVLQELFHSARSVNASHEGLQEARSNADSQQKGDGATADKDKQPKSSQMPDQMTQQQALELLQKGPSNMANSGAAAATKGNPLSDPSQQQHFLEALRKLHIQQQQLQFTSQQQQGDQAHRHPNSIGTSEAANPFLAAYPQLAGLQHLLQQQQQAMQIGNLQAAINSGRGPSPLGVVSGVVPVTHQQAAGSSTVPAQAINPAFAGFLPPANVPPPPITQHDLIMAHTQSLYQRALISRKSQGIEEQQPPPKSSAVQQSVAGGGKLPTAFLPTSVIKQMHGSVKPNKEGGDEPNIAAARPIVKQQAAFSGHQQEQVSPSSMNEQLLRNLQQQQNANKAVLPGPSGSAVGTQQSPLAPPPSLTPQDLQRLIDQSHLQQRQQRQHQERVLLEQYAKTQQQQQVGTNPATAATAMNPAAITAALALQNNPMFVQMLRAQAMQAQQMALLQQQAAVAAGSGLPQAPPPPIPASAAVSAIPNAAQLVRARMAAPPPVPAAAASNPDLMRHVLQQQQQQQMLLNQLRQQAPADANLLLNRLLTGQAAQQQQVHQMSAVPLQSASSVGGHYPAQSMVDAKPMTLEELERLHKQTTAMQQPQS